MSAGESVSTRLDQIFEEHRQLHHLLDRTHAALSSESTARILVAARLAELRDQLELHFAHEEVDGYFKDVVRRAPQAAELVEALNAEHPRLFAAIEQLAKFVDESADEADWRDSASQRFADLIRQLALHERRENRMVQDAYNNDIGTSN